MDSGMFENASWYEELEILLSVNCLTGEKRNVLMEISRYNDDSAYRVRLPLDVSYG